MDFLEESKYCNLIQRLPSENGYMENGYNEPIDPNIISGYGWNPPALPDYYSVPITRTDEEYQERRLILSTDVGYSIPIPEKPVYKVPYTPPDEIYTPDERLETERKAERLETKKIETEGLKAEGFELEEFIKKPEVMGIGALIAIVLIIKFI